MGFHNTIRHRASAATLCALALTLLLAGCSVFHHTPQVTIPLLENAGKQYAYAVSQREQSNLELISEKGRFKKAQAIVREHFRKVAELYPGDRKYTPLAKLDVIEIDAGLAFSRVPPTTKEIRTAIGELKKLAAEYPDYDPPFIQAKALLDEGFCYKTLRDYPKAQACFKQVSEKYINNGNEKIRDLARLGSINYHQSYTNE